MHTVQHLSIGAVGGAVLGWLVLWILYVNFIATPGWRSSLFEYYNQRVPEAFWRWSVYAALTGALIGTAVVAIKYCARLPGHPWIC